MKLLCVFDPFILFPPPTKEQDAALAFSEHTAALQEHGFKIVLSDYLKEMLLTIPIGSQELNSGFYAAFFSYLTGPDSEATFLEVSIPSGSNLFCCGEESFANHERFEHDADLADLYSDHAGLLCYLHKNYSFRVRYASGGRGGIADSEEYLESKADNQHKVPIVRRRFDWRETYRQTRRHPADKLPSHGLAPLRHHPVLAYVPPADFKEDNDTLASEPLDDAMVKLRKWKPTKGKSKTVGYYDRWRNCWVWNTRANHWDVQITDQLKNSLSHSNPVKKPDYHLNVQPSSDPFPGEIIHGFSPLMSSISAYVLIDDD